MDTVTKTISFKRIEFYAGRRREFSPPDAHTFLNGVWQKTRAIGDILWSCNESDNKARRAFMQDCNQTGAGFFFEFCSYLPGHYPSALKLDFGSKSVEIDTHPPAQASDGKSREYVSVMQCLALGQVLIVEQAKGTGGLYALRGYITHLLRKFSGDEHHPAVHLLDCVTPELRETIERGGGATQVVMPFVDVDRSGEVDSRRRRLADLGRTIGGTTKLFTIFHSDKGGTLDTDDVIDAYNEAFEDEDLECTIVLRTGKIKPGAYRMNRRVPLPAFNGMRPSRTAIREELKAYMMELQGSNGGKALVTEHGRIAPRNLT